MATLINVTHGRAPTARRRPSTGGHPPRRLASGREPARVHATRARSRACRESPRLRTGRRRRQAGHCGGRPGRDPAEPGVAVVVGPNGSGKSNVSDGIVWAAGSLSPSELRAEKPDDVLFAGARGARAGRFLRGRALSTTPTGRARSTTRSSRSPAGCTAEAKGSTSSTAQRAAARPRRAARRPRAGRRDALDHRAGQGRGGAVGVAGAPSGDDRGGGGAGAVQAQRHRAELKLQRVEIQVERARDVEAR